jgi:hypothetical protein
MPLLLHTLPLIAVLWGPVQAAPAEEAADTAPAKADAAKAPTQPAQLTYPIVDTAQQRCYNDRHEIAYPSRGGAFDGQDAQYAGNAPRYRDNGDGTVSDLVTGLMWQADPGDKKTYAQALAGAKRCRTGGYHDWRLPTIKQLYSLILFSGTDPDPRGPAAQGERPFIDTRFFKFRYGSEADGERRIDAQFASSTRYTGKTMNGNATMFGVNFADGRIKGYPIGRIPGRGEKTYFVLYVRGNASYGQNRFVDNGDGTITDRATGLTWMQLDSGHLKAGHHRDGRLNWQEALAWAQGLEYAGHDDWRLPSAKELQSIVDYTRSPQATRSAAIDPLFKTSRVRVEEGRTDYPFFWSSTTHAGRASAHQAAYVAFGEGLGYMPSPRGGEGKLMDVHGAGCQRSDPKAGDPADLPRGHGPQGDVQRIYNFARCVRGGGVVRRDEGPDVELTAEVVRRATREAQRRDEDQTRPGDGERPDGPNRQGRRDSRSGGDTSKRPVGASAFIRRLDRDGDGKVSRSEFDGPARGFGAFDRDNDGYISADEAPTTPPPGRPAP